MSSLHNGGPGGGLDGGPDGAPARTAVGRMKFGDHLCLTYDNEEERYAVLMAYIRDGLRADHKIIYLADQENPRDVLERLAAEAGKDEDALRTAADEGHLAIRPIIEAFMATGRFDPDETVALLGTEIELALVQGYDGVRITGETSFSVRGWPGTEHFAEFEHKCQQAFQAPGTRAMAICQYDRRWFGPDQLRILESCHDGRVRVDDLYADGVLTITPTFTPPGLRLTGAVDESTLPGLLEALHGAAGRAGHLCLDLSGLEFCDLEGLRVLIGAGREGASLERQVVLRGMPDYLGLMMRLAGWDSAPGVYLEGAIR
ncbi:MULTISPECIES: MEDS domain-containing protein [Actinomadura]|uniref:MEDS domain-containing protein n=1 Tax=Actinomadura yumaensis TaxID=111807 RepID=A0ABW2D1V2_9ACTN|nr:MEDS domain-containing protein [Actinomadura sp. J1-007]